MASLPTPELATASDLVEFLEDQHVAIRMLFDAALSPEKGHRQREFHSIAWPARGARDC